MPEVESYERNPQKSKHRCDHHFERTISKTPKPLEPRFVVISRRVLVGFGSAMQRFSIRCCFESGRSTQNLPIFSILIGNLPYFGDEPIAASWDSRNKPAILGILTESFADRGNVHGEVNFFYEGVRPDLFKQFVLREHPSLITHETNKGLESLRGERNRVSFTGQHVFCRIQEERTE